jgi:O-methyltransferase
MSLISFARRLLGREQILRLSYTAYRHGLVINSPMNSIKSCRNDEVLKGEYIRSSSLELVAREIKERSVAGAVAELGVYRGEFARLINVAFPDKKLYLFDTFAGFDANQLEEDLVNKRLEGSFDNFSETSLSIVLAKMKFKDNCVVVPGVFPDSALSCPEIKYAFVSIDCDLYRPIYEGLHYFYPKLSSGGYIFVHDYNNTFYNGAKQAVRQFVSEQQVSYFPLSDASGSAVICKA